MADWKSGSGLTAQRVAERMSRTSRGLLVLNAVLSVLLVLAWTTPWLDLPSGVELDAEEALADGALGVADHHVAASEVGRVTTGKVVFRTNQAVSDKVVDELGRYEFRGFTQRDGKVRAFIRDTKRKKTLTKGVGELLEPFEITAIDRGGVRLRRGNEEFYLKK